MAKDPEPRKRRKQTSRGKAAIPSVAKAAKSSVAEAAIPSVADHFSVDEDHKQKKERNAVLLIAKHEQRRMRSLLSLLSLLPL